VAAIFDFPLPVQEHHNIRSVTLRLLNLENVSIAVKFHFYLTYMSNKCGSDYFPDSVAAILDFPLPFWLYNIRSSSFGLLDPTNVGVAF